MKLIIQYTCPVCRKVYQESQGVEIVNKFGFLKPTAHRLKVCKECNPDLTDTA